MTNNVSIKLKEIHIDFVPNKYKQSFYDNAKKAIPIPDCCGILVERRNHKVKTDENKLFGTKENHKYF